MAPPPKKPAPPTDAASCRAQGGIPVYDPRTGQYAGCANPGQPVRDVLDEWKRKQKRAQILWTGALVLVAIVWLSD